MSNIDIFSVDAEDMPIAAEFILALRRVFHGESGNLILTGDIRENLERLPFGSGIDDATWCTSEPESVTQFYANQVLQGANATICLMGKLTQFQLNKHHLRVSQERCIDAACRVAQRAGAHWICAEIICDADLFGLRKDQISKEDTCNDSGVLDICCEVQKMIEASLEFVHGVWIDVKTPELLELTLQGICQAQDLPCIVCADVKDLPAVCEIVKAHQLASVKHLSDIIYAVRVLQPGDLDVLMAQIAHFEASKKSTISSVVRPGLEICTESDMVDVVSHAQALDIHIFRAPSHQKARLDFYEDIQD